MGRHAFENEALEGDRERPWEGCIKSGHSVDICPGQSQGKVSVPGGGKREGRRRAAAEGKVRKKAACWQSSQRGASAQGGGGLPKSQVPCGSASIWSPQEPGAELVGGNRTKQAVPPGSLLSVLSMRPALQRAQNCFHCPCSYSGSWPF